VVALRVNGELKGDAFVIRENGVFWVRTSRLAASGLVHASGTERTFDGQPYFSLPSLAPGITSEFDEAALELRLNATPEMFEETTLVLQSRRPPDIEYSRTTGLFLNYDALYQQGSQPTATVEAGLSVKGALAQTIFTRTPDNAIVRGLSSLTIDAPHKMIRTEFGDTTARATLLGSLPTVAGASVSRDFSLDPYQLPYPLPAVSGSVPTQAVAEVYVNGTIVRRERLPPGAFSLQRLPVAAGLGNVQVVVRDRLGHEQVFGEQYYFTSTVLEKGDHDFEYLFGSRRNDQANANPTYGPATGSVFHRYGVTDWLTLGARGEGDPHVFSGGPTMNLRVAEFGEVEAEGAVSQSNGIVDYAAAGSYAFTARRFTLSATAQWMRPHFATLDLGPDDSRNSLQLNASASVSIGRATLTAFHSDNSGSAPPADTPPPNAVPVEVSPADTLDQPAPTQITAERRNGAALTMQFGTRTQATVSAARVHSDLAPRGWDGFASLSVLLGPRAVATAGVTQSGDGATSSVLSAQKSLPLGPGIGYRVEWLASTQSAETARAQFQAQNRFGQVTLRDDSVDGQNTASIELAGSVVAAARQIRLGRTITEGYAVVQVPDNPGVRVFVNNQLAGRTGRGGTIVVPDLLPYYANPVRIADEDVALEYQLSRTSAIVAPPNRGPALVKFGAVLFRGVSGRIVVIENGERVTPAFGDVTIDEPGRESSKSPIGANGEFYLENVPAGRHNIRIDFQDGSCHATIEVPSEIRIAVDIGEVVCELKKL
jgi:outer membrane usher protein